MRIRLLAWCVASAVFIAACSSGGGGDGGDGAARRPTPSRTDPVESAPVRVVTLNLLHGLFCPEDTDFCRAPDRVQIFAEHVEAADCPDLIGLQEINTRLEELLIATVPSLCDGAYEIAWQPVTSPDRSMVLTRLPVVDSGYLDIANFPWEAYWVRVRSAQGPVDFLTAHFASSSNNPDCTAENCPAVCPAGIRTNECHALEVVELFDAHDPATLTIVAGDLNATIDSPTLAHFRDAGFADAWLEGGGPECDPVTHAGCTSGGSQPAPFEGMDTLEGPGFNRRIDFVLARPAGDCALSVVSEGFAVTPRATPLNGMWWPSDHGGVLATLRCA